MTHDLPLRYSLRAYHDEKDLAPLIDILTRSQRLFGVTQNTSLDMLRVQFEHPTGWRPKQDVRIVEASDGVCAWSRTSWKDVPEGERVYTIELYLDPASYDSVLQRYLLDDAQERATEKALIHRKACGPQFFTVLVPDTDAATVDLLRSNGYVRIRQSVEMVRQPIDNLRPIGSLPLGLNERAVSDHDLPSIWRVERLARRGLWGEEPLTNAVYQRFVRMPLRDNSLFTVIWSGNNDVAHTLAFIDPEENEQNRYRRLSIWSTVVHPDYRRFSLGAFVLRRAIEKAHDRGMTSVSLSTDPDLPGRVIDLYRFLRFEVESSRSHWRRPVFPSDPAALVALKNSLDDFRGFER